MAGDARGAVADQLFPDARPHAVAADQRAALGALARLQRDRDRVAVVDEILHPLVVLERDQVAALAGGEEYPVDVGPVGDRIGVLEAVDERLPQGDAGDQLAGDGVAHLLRGRPPCIGEHLLGQADAVECAEDVGAELDAGAELAEFRRLLEHPHREALAGERIGRRQAADPAARNDDRKVLAGNAAFSRHSVLGIWSGSSCSALPSRT